MSNFFSRQSASFRNDLNRSIGALIGIAQGLICDRHLNDTEVLFLNQWLQSNENIALIWPGDVVHARIQEVLADGVVTEDERAYLIETLRELVGGTLEDLADAEHVSELMFDQDVEVLFEGRRFCLTGNFVFAPRNSCAEAIERRRGTVASAVSKKTHYLVVGSMGSPEWKHGSFGTKVEQAMALKNEGAEICLVDENRWASALARYPCP